jgi:excisionase family DNA binding protein
MSSTRLTLADLDGRLTCSVPEAGQLLGIGRDAAYAAAARGELPTLQLGRTLRVPLPKLLALLGILEAAPTLETDGSTDGNSSPGLRLIRDDVTT